MPTDINEPIITSHIAKDTTKLIVERINVAAPSFLAAWNCPTAFLRMLYNIIQLKNYFLISIDPLPCVSEWAWQFN